ncbi:type III effector protein [Ralstonia solanacearum]|uniref:type III effector protein n=1 Tax=Ralstonia solanacearum TaxID=305 RepID=UPI00202ABCFB|nr:type III effector protein [Ralstonia solanacearum]MCL9844417.1 type III effector protein [Ralstonia solanacearum]MDC6253262.1 type III effector protein [Ralstonia solanacearum]MDC6257864.1 type III effector protein [Ralstonia solanacearum]MDC6303908.1 type III effector protein [Ralstonia solanacearum]
MPPRVPARCRGCPSRGASAPPGSRSLPQQPAVMRRSRSLSSLGGMHADPGIGDTAARLGTRTLRTAPPASLDAGLPVAADAEHRPPASGHALWKLADARVLLRRGESRAFVDALRQSPTEREMPGAGAKLERLLSHVGQMRDGLNKVRQYLAAAGQPDSALKALSRNLDGIERALVALREDKPLAHRTFWVASASLLAAVMPITVPLASRPRQAQFASETFGLMAKMFVEAAAMIRTQTTDRGLLKDRWLSRNLINNVQAVWFMPSVIKPTLTKNLPYNITGGMVSVAVLFMTFLSSEIREKVNGWRNQPPYPGLAQAGQNLDARMQADLRDVLATVNADMQSLVDTKAAFEDAHELNPLVSKQVSLAVNAYKTLSVKLMDTLGVPHAVAASNPDKAAKLALAVFTAMICFSGAALMVPDRIGMVDLTADAIFTSLYQASLVGDGNVSRKDALDEFKTFSGFSMVLAAMLALNKGAGDFIEHGAMGLLIGSVSMAALNLVLPGPVGHATAKGIEKLMSMSPSDISQTLYKLGDCFYRWCGGGAATEAAHPQEPDLEAGPSAAAS